MTGALVAAVVMAVIIGFAMEGFSAFVIAAIVGIGLVFGGQALITNGALAGVMAGVALTGMLAVGTVGFWLLLAASTITLACLVENEKGAWATGTLFITLVLLQLLGDVQVFSYLYQHPFVSFLCVCGYFGAGVAWSVWKWLLYNRDQRTAYDELRTKFLKEKGVTDNVLSETLKEEFETWVNNNRIDIRPQVTNHKERVLRWMTYWPWSALAWLLSDPIRRLFRELYHQVQSFLQKISDRIWQGVENDLPPVANTGRRGRTQR